MAHCTVHIKVRRSSYNKLNKAVSKMYYVFFFYFDVVVKCN